MWFKSAIAILLVYASIAFFLFAVPVLKESSANSSIEAPPSGTLALELMSIFHRGLTRFNNGGIEPSFNDLLECLTIRLAGVPPGPVHFIIFAFLKWLRFPFGLMEMAAPQVCIFHFLYMQYQLASMVVKLTRYRDQTRCRHGTGAVNARSKTCSFCWDDIGEDQRSTDHMDCHNFFHRDCLQQWITRGGHKFALCPLCRGCLGDYRHIPVNEGNF